MSPRARALAGLLLLTSSSVSASSSVAMFKDEEIAPGVFVVTSLEPLGLANHSNAAFVVSDEDVILVDTQFTRKRTLDVLGVMRGAADVSVGVLINTHWHDDHTFGNQVIRHTNPDVEIIAHTLTKRDMAGIGVTNRAQQVAGGGEALAMFRSSIEKKTGLDGTPMSAEEHFAYESTVAIVQEYLDEQTEFRLTLPTKTFNDRMVLKRDQRTIEIRHFGPAVTEGDAVVWLPAERVLIAGDLVDNPLPFAYGCHVSGWIAALDSITALHPRIIVPGHGAVLKGTAHVERLSVLLRSIRDQAQAAVARGETVEDARKHVDVGQMRGAIVGNDKMLAFLFDNFFVGQVVQSACNEAARK